MPLHREAITHSCGHPGERLMSERQYADLERRAKCIAQYTERKCPPCELTDLPDGTVRHLQTTDHGCIWQRWNKEAHEWQTI